jgi:hypothetical protein
MKQCWAFEPERRIDIGQLVLRLREAVAESNKLRIKYDMKGEQRKQKEDEKKEQEEEQKEKDSQEDA